MARGDKRSGFLIGVRFVLVIIMVTVATTLARWQLPGLLFPLDLYLVVVLIVALRRTPMETQLFAVSAGLAEDAFSGGLIGVNALSLIIIGFIVAVLKEAISIRGLFQQTGTIFIATFINALVLFGIHAVFSLPYSIIWSGLALKAAVNALAGLIFILLFRRRDKRHLTMNVYERS
jgi:rod shape-determining protein MreD